MVECYYNSIEKGGKMSKKRNDTDLANPKLYLVDKPTVNDKFHYNHIAQTLEETLIQSEFPTHIGLMGDWGSGKSTVLKLLEDLLQKNQNYAMKTISVWKFSDNSTSLQRKIIREIQSTLGIEDNNGLDSITEEQETLRVSGTIGAFLFGFLKNKNFVKITLGFLLLQPLFFLAPYFLFSTWVDKILGTLGLNTLFIVSILGLIVKQLSSSNLRLQTQSTYKPLPLDYGDQFENRFNRIVEKFLKGDKKKKLILVFDDLDRLPPNQLYSTLNTIRTFLNSKDCGFIIPCDESILRMELETAFEQKSFDSDVSEYLNKTFDVIIKLPRVEQTNMKVYAEQLLKEEKIEWFEDKEIQQTYRNILGTLIHTDINTPRKVKKILNAFASDWYLAKKRDNVNGRSILTKNPEILAIYTVLKTNYLNFYGFLQENPMIFKGKESVEDIEEEVYKIIEDKHGNQDKTNSEDKVTEKFIPLQFLSRVFDRIQENYDPRPYLYFSNKELNPITSVKELNELKEMALNGEIDKFKNSFKNIVGEQKTLFLDTLIYEIYSDDEYINTLRCLFSYPESFKSILRSRDDWEFHIGQNYKNIEKTISLENIAESLYQMNASSNAWGRLGDYISANKKINELVNVWISKSYIKHKIGNLNFAKIIEDKYISINESNNDLYYLPSQIIDLPNDHSMINTLKWDELLLESINYIKERNEEEEKKNKDNNENQETQEIELIPQDLPFNLIDWIRAVNTKTNTKIQGEWLKSFAEAYDLSNQEKIIGIGDYWEEILSTSTDVFELEHIIHVLAHINDSEVFFTNSTWEILNEKISGGMNTKVIESKLIKFIVFLKDNNFDIFKEIIPAMRDVGFITKWCIESYSYDNSEMDLIKEVNILHKVESFDVSPLFKNANDRIINLEVDVIESMNRLLTSSPGLYEYGLKNDYYIEWFNLKNEDILNLHPEDELKKLLGFYSHIQSDKKAYFTKVESFAEYILSYSDVLNNPKNSPQGKYKNLWNQHIDVIFSHLLDLSENVEWDVALKRLQKVQLVYNYQVEVSILSYLNSAILDNAIPIISARTNLDNKEVNDFIVHKMNLNNDRHLKSLANRWVYLNQNDKDTLILNAKNANIYNELINSLESVFKLHTNLEYIKEISFEEFYDSDKQRLVEALIGSSDVQSIKDWLNNLFANISNTISHWEYVAALNIIDIRKTSPKIDAGTIRDALSFKDTRTILALKVIPIIYKRSDRNAVKDLLRDKILELENDNEFSEYATLAKNVFGWKKQRRGNVKV